MDQFPPASEYSIKTVPKFFSKIHGYIHKSRCTTSINDTGGKFATGVNNGNNYQTADNLNELENFFYLHAKSTTQRCPKEIIKHFLIEDFFHLAPVSTTPVANFELRISSRIFAKNLKRPKCYNQGLEGN